MTMRTGFSRLVPALGVCIALFALPARSDDEDHERARQAREAGRILPLAQILDAVERDFAGRVLEVELEDENGRLVYELRLLAPGGTILELEYDARSAVLLRGRGHALERARRDAEDDD